MHHIVVGPVLQHLRMIGLDQGAVTLATAFYSGRALTSLSIQAESVTVFCRLDLNSTEEWKRGLVAPDALLSFLQAQQQRGASAQLYAAPTAHAKVYLGNRAVLIGSANLTMSGFGGGYEILSRLHGRQALQKADRALNEYQNSLKKIEFDVLQEYVETNRDIVRRAKSQRKKEDQLPEVNRSVRPHLGSYDNFLNWLRKIPKDGASEILERAGGKHNLQGHIDRNFHGLRQFFLAFPEAFHRMRTADPDTYKLSKDNDMEEQLRDFVLRFATDEEDFVLDVWKTYLPVECGGKAGRHGGTIGNLNYMLPLVAIYLADTLALDPLDRV